MADSYVCSGATMKCSMGTNQAKLTVLPLRTVYLTGQPMANISDHLSMVNLAPFGRCRSLGFPATASATAAAHGKLTPMPCMHNTPFPWIGGKNDYIIKGDPALLKSSTCSCMWGGTISIVDDGQVGEGTQWVKKKDQQLFDLLEQKKQRLKEFREKLQSIEKVIKAERGKTLRDISTFLKNNPNWFKNGEFQLLDVNEKCVNDEAFNKDEYPPNGYTYKDGRIYLRPDIMNDCLSAFRKIENNKKLKEDQKEKLTETEERSLATLWHEINHNMHDATKDSDAKLTNGNRAYMEIANEFVSRKTLPDFYEALGSNMSYPKFMSNRENTGYNPRVVKYQNAISKYKLDESIVINTVKKGLFETDYHKQKANLINGLVMGGLEEEKAKEIVEELLTN